MDANAAAEDAVSAAVIAAVIEMVVPAAAVVNAGVSPSDVPFSY